MAALLLPLYENHVELKRTVPLFRLILPLHKLYPSTDDVLAFTNTV